MYQDSKDAAPDDTAHRQELAHLREEKQKLELQLAHAARQLMTFAERCAWAEAQTGHIARMYTAVCQLNEVRDRSEALRVIQEVVINFLGSEEVGLFERRPGGTLELVSSIGIDREALGTLEVGFGLIGRCAASSLVYLVGDDEAEPLPQETGLTACVPLRSNHGTAGVIAIFRLLPQKKALAPEDRDLLEMLASQAGAAFMRGVP